MTFAEELSYMRAVLVRPGIQAQGLHHSQTLYFAPKFLAECISEYEKCALTCLAQGEKAAPLQRLAIEVLRSAAGLS